MLLHKSSLLVLYTITIEEKGQASRKKTPLYFSKLAKMKKNQEKYLHIKKNILLFLNLNILNIYL